MLRSIVEVKTLPQIINKRDEATFFEEIEECMHEDRPRIVLDCSEIKKADDTIIHLLLCCLEAAMKRNGDVKLAEVRPEAAIVLEAQGINRLFEMYRTTDAAVDSFHQHSMEAILARFSREENSVLQTETAA